MKIAIVTAGTLPVPAINGGAVETLTTYLIEGFLENSNNYVDVYTVKSKKLSEYNTVSNLKIKQYGKSKIGYFVCRCLNYFFKMIKKNIVIFPYDLKVSKEIKNNEYDYIIVENNLCLYRNVHKRYKHKAKFIFHIHNSINDNRSKEAYKYVCKTADEVIYVSKFLKNECLDVAIPKKAEILYNCIDFDMFVKKEYMDIRNKYKIPNKNLLYIFTGRLIEEKGVYELIQAFQKLNMKYNNVNLMIVGSANFGNANKDKYFNKLKESANNNNNIIFTGFISTDCIADYLNNSDIVVIPSKCKEAFGVVALEAMIMKKAIISTNSGGLTEPLNNRSAIIVERKNLIDNLYNAMEEIYINNELKEKLAENAWKRVYSIKEFDKKNYFENFIKLSDINIK